MDQETLIPVKFGDFDPDGNFFMVRHDKFKKLTKLYDKIDAFTGVKSNCRPLADFEPGTNCLGHFDGIHSRCRLVRALGGEEYEVYLCDTGELDSIKATELIETEDSITSFVPFVAIRGKLAGVLPKDDKFDDEEIEEMLDELEKVERSLYVRVIKLNPNTDTWNTTWGLNFYDVLLLSVDDGKVSLLNQTFIDLGMKNTFLSFFFSFIFLKISSRTLLLWIARSNS